MQRRLHLAKYEVLKLTASKLAASLYPKRPQKKKKRPKRGAFGLFAARDTADSQKTSEHSRELTSAHTHGPLGLSPWFGGKNIPFSSPQNNNYYYNNHATDKIWVVQIHAEKDIRSTSLEELSNRVTQVVHLILKQTPRAMHHKAEVESYASTSITSRPLPHSARIGFCEPHSQPLDSKAQAACLRQHNMNHGQ